MGSEVDFCFMCEVQSLAVAKDIGLNVDLNSLFRHSELRTQMQLLKTQVRDRKGGKRKYEFAGLEDARRENISRSTYV